MTDHALPDIPADPGVESEILGACIGSPRGFSVVAEKLQRDDFFDPEHQKIFRALLELAAANQEITEWALKEVLESDTEFRNANGVARLSQCSVHGFLGLASLSDACRRVKRLSTKRRALYLGYELAGKARWLRYPRPNYLRNSGLGSRRSAMAALIWAADRDIFLKL
jgi:replicative DNA helicase